MTRSLFVAAVALGGWALVAVAADAGPNRAATDTAVAACKAQYAGGGMTATQLWQCSDKAELAYEKSHDPLNMDLYTAAATRDEQIAALFDSGKLSKAEADALYDSTDAEVQKTLKGRRDALNENRPTSCAKYSDISSTGNVNCY
jgi:hypothetical protein